MYKYMYIDLCSYVYMSNLIDWKYIVAFPGPGIDTKSDYQSQPPGERVNWLLVLDWMNSMKTFLGHIQPPSFSYILCVSWYLHMYTT